MQRYKQIHRDTSSQSSASPEPTSGLDQSGIPVTLAVDDELTEQTEGSKNFTTVKERRDLLNAKLKGYIQEKHKRELPVETQLYNGRN